MDSVPNCDGPLRPAPRRLNSNSGGTREDGAGQGPDKSQTDVRADPPASALHNTELQRTADNEVPQETVEVPRSDTATAGKKKNGSPHPEIVVTGPVSDVSPIVSPVEWRQVTPLISVLRAKSSHPQGHPTPVFPIDYSMTLARSDMSADARTGRNGEASISPITEAGSHRDDQN